MPAGQIFFTMAIITFGLSSILSGLNFLVTIIHLRAPGMTWGRLPSSSGRCYRRFHPRPHVHPVLRRGDADDHAGPHRRVHVLTRIRAGRRSSTSTSSGSTHTGGLHLRAAGLGITLEVLAHFSRKPLFAYRWAVGGLLGIVGVRGVVWAHHMFVSGMATGCTRLPRLDEVIISVPTGFMFLSALGTIWKGSSWLTRPCSSRLASSSTS